MSQSKKNPQPKDTHKNPPPPPPKQPVIIAQDSWDPVNTSRSNINVNKSKQKKVTIQPP